MSTTNGAIRGPDFSHGIECASHGRDHLEHGPRTQGQQIAAGAACPDLRQQSFKIARFARHRRSDHR